MESNRSVIIRVIAKSDDCEAEVRFVYHESYYQLIIKITISDRRRIAKLRNQGLYTVSMVIETKIVIGWFKLQLWMWLAYWTAG